MSCINRDTALHEDIRRHRIDDCHGLCQLRPGRSVGRRTAWQALVEPPLPSALGRAGTDVLSGCAPAR